MYHNKIDIKILIYSRDISKAININKTRRPGTTRVSFSVATGNDEHRKPEFKINCRG